MFSLARALPEDVEEMVKLGKALHETSEFRHVSYSLEKTSNFTHYCINSADHIVITVKSSEEDAIVGYFIGFIGPFFFSDDLVSFDMSFFLSPHFRNYRAAFQIVKKYKEWATEKGAKRIMLSQSTGLDTARTSRLYERFGFKDVGANLCFVPV
jgi:GNAT superfamily N-acetyltransferase